MWCQKKDVQPGSEGGDVLVNRECEGVGCLGTVMGQREAGVVPVRPGVQGPGTPGV